MYPTILIHSPIPVQSTNCSFGGTNPRAHWRMAWYARKYSSREDEPRLWAGTLQHAYEEVGYQAQGLSRQPLRSLGYWERGKAIQQADMKQR